MNYDVWGSFSPNVGPNSPLDDTCAADRDKDGSAVSAVNAWHGAGFPIDKMILGVAAYGHSYHVNKSSGYDKAGNVKLYAYFDKADQPAGDKWDSTATGVDSCGNPNVVGGIFNFWGLIDAGFLASDGVAASGISYRFNKCAKTVCILHTHGSCG
jgi:chitinase